MKLFRFCLAGAWATLLAACSPTLDWREVRAEGSGATALFPCKASAQTRPVRLAGLAVQWTLHACSAGGATWALAFADMADPARVGPALQELRQTAAANVAASAPAGTPQPAAVPGATPNPASARLRLQGQRPDGTVVREELAVFAHGTRVFQATVLGAEWPAEGAETFFSALRVGP